MVSIKTRFWESEDIKHWKETTARISWYMGFMALINCVYFVTQSGFYMLLINLFALTLAILMFISKNKHDKRKFAEKQKKERVAFNEKGKNEKGK